MGFWAFVSLAVVAAAQSLSFIFNETYAIYGQGAFWDSTWSHLALMGTSHMPDSNDPLFFNDGRGVVFTGQEVVRLPPHPLDPSPVSLGSKFAFEFWFRADISWPSLIEPANQYLLYRISQKLDQKVLGVLFKRTSSLTATTITIRVLDLWITGTSPESLSITIPRVVGSSESWDRWFHMVINVDATTATNAKVFLDGVLVQSSSVSSQQFKDDPNAALFLGGYAAISTGVPDYSSITADESHNQLMIYSVKIYSGVTRSEFDVRNAITNNCLSRFDHGDIKFLCDACPVNLGKCLYSGCSHRGFQRTSAECMGQTDCLCASSSYCTSDSVCAACSSNDPGLYLADDGTCKTCKVGCAACGRSGSCYECRRATKSPWTGGIVTDRGKCGGTFALRMDASCAIGGLTLPLPKADYSSWSFELWVFINSAAEVGGGYDYEILNLGDYQLIYTTTAATATTYNYRLKLRTRAGETYNDSTGTFTIAQWVKVALSVGGGSVTFMVWNGFAATTSGTDLLKITRPSATDTSTPFISVPTQISFCSKKCDVLIRDFRLWTTTLSDTSVFDTRFKLFLSPPSTLVSYWLLNEGTPVVFDYSFNGFNRTLPVTRGQCWWEEQEVQYVRLEDSTTQVKNGGMYGFLQCPEKRPEGDLLFFCNEEIRFIFSQKCMPQDILDINRTVVARRGSSGLPDSADPVFDGKDAGLYFSGSSYLEIDPKLQAFQPVSETRWSSRQSDSRGVMMPLNLAAFSVQAWVKPTSLPTLDYSSAADITGVYSLFSIMHTNGHYQFMWFLQKTGVGVSTKSSSDGTVVTQQYNGKAVPTDSWTFLAFSFSQQRTNEGPGVWNFLVNGETVSFTPVNNILVNSLSDLIVREQAPMFIGAAVQGTVLGNFYKGYMFEFALSNYVKSPAYVQGYDYDYLYSVWFGGKVELNSMQGNECACHFSCLTCKSPATGRPEECKTCAAPLVLTSSGTCKLSCGSNEAIKSETDRTCTTVTPPNVKSAVFTSDFLGIKVEFDAEVAPNTLDNSCERMFAQETNAMLGSGAYCYMSDTLVLNVIFGQSPSLPLSGSILLHPQGFLKAGVSIVTYANVGPTTITSPPPLVSPVAVIAGADLSPVAADDVTVDASLSRGGLGRQLLYKWSVVADGVTLSADLTKFLSKYSDYTTTSLLTIPSSLAPSSVRVTYTVTVQNWLGQTNSASLDSFHTLRPVPVMYFAQGRTKNVRRWEKNVFQLNLVRSALAEIPSDKDFNIRLIDSNADLTANPLNLNKADFLNLNQTLTIPAFSLQVGKYYRFAVELTSKLHPESNSFASLYLNVVQSGFVAQIVGGDRTIGLSDQVNVTASGSLELDTGDASNLVFSWKCPDCTPSSLANSASFNATITSATAAGKTILVSLTVSSKIQGDKRTADEYAEFALVTGTRPYVFVHRLTSSTSYLLLPEKTNFAYSEAYSSIATSVVKSNVEWRASPQPEDFTPKFVPKSQFLYTAVQGSGLYVPTHGYKLMVTLDESSTFTSAWLRTTVNARPIGCCFAASLIPGSRSLFLFSAGHYEDSDEHYPLSYVFGLDKDSLHLGFGSRTSSRKYILPSRTNTGANSQVTVYSLVIDALGATTEEKYEVVILPETPKYSLQDFVSEAKATYGATYNQTELDQYVLASYGAYLADQLDANAGNLDRSAATSELNSLVATLQSTFAAGDKECFAMGVYLRDLALLSRFSAVLSSDSAEALYNVAVGLVTRVIANPDVSCWSAADKERFATVIDNFAALFSGNYLKSARLQSLIELLGIASLRDAFPGYSISYFQQHFSAKFWRIPVENSDYTYEFFFDESNTTTIQKTGVSFPTSGLSSKSPGNVIDVHLALYGFNGLAPLRLDKYPSMLASYQAERREIKENSQGCTVEVRFYDSGTTAQGSLNLATPKLFQLGDVQSTLSLPASSYQADTFLHATCESWQSDPTKLYGGEWSIGTCAQNSTVSDAGVVTCTCKGAPVFSSNTLASTNLGPLRPSIYQATLDPEYDLRKEINDNRGFMFYMNAIYLLFILWSLHGGATIVAYILDRDNKPEFPLEEYRLIVGTERPGQNQQNLPAPTCVNYWLNEWWLTGLFRMTKAHYTRCARVHILFSKMYVLLIVPGFFYTYYWTDHQAFDIHGYDWGVTVISLICSAAAQGVLSVLSNTHNVVSPIKYSLYIAYFGLWSTMWLAIGFWTAKGTTQTASIWCVVWILCAFIDVLILDHIYVMVKWGFDSVTDYWRIVPPPAEPQDAGS